LNNYRNQLREIGMKEYEIEMELQGMKDEFVAQRLRRQMSLEDNNHIMNHYSTCKLFLVVCFFLFWFILFCFLFCWFCLFFVLLDGFSLIVGF
jgi:hypothetical protein